MPLLRTSLPPSAQRERRIVRSYQDSIRKLLAHDMSVTEIADGLIGSVKFRGNHGKLIALTVRLRDNQNTPPITIH